MAYGKIFYYKWKNIQNDIFRVDILRDGYSGAITQLQATSNPFTISPVSGDNQIYSPVKPLAVSLEFWSKNNGGEGDNIPAYSIGIEDLYSDGQNAFKVNFYNERLTTTGLTPSNGAMPQLLFSGFLQIDNSDQQLQDKAVPISLQGNDNLGLLQTIALNTALGPVPSNTVRYTQSGSNVITTASEDDHIGHNNLFQCSNVPSDPGIQPGDVLLFMGTYYNIISSNYLPFSTFLTIVLTEHINTNTFTGVTFTVYASMGTIAYGFFKIKDILSSILQATSLQLETDAYLNIFENTTDDRTIVDTNDFLQQTVLHTNYFLDGNGLFKDCYTVLTAICHDFGMTLTQANGRWVIVRFAENRLFTNNAVPGTRYDYQFNIIEAITEDPIQTIGRNEAGSEVQYSFEPIGANQLKRILRPLIYSKRTLNYVFPDWIDDQRFTILGALFSYSGFLYPAFTYNSIEYIGWKVPSDWYLQTAEIACLVTAYDTTIGNTQVDLFLDILTQPGAGNKWLQFNPIPVVKNSKFSFSLDFFAFWTNHLGPVPPPSHGAFYCRCRFQLLDNAGNIYFLEQVSSGGANYLQWNGPNASSTWNSDVGLEVTGDENYGNTNNYDVSTFATQGTVPVFPVDGMFLIGLCGSNGHVVDYDTGIRNINLNIDNNLGAISSMTGQFYNQQQPEVVKNNSEEDINLSDTIVNTISGTTLTNALTSFGIWVGDTYVTKTYRWHRAALVEALALQQINTFDTLFIQRIARLIVEGDFSGLTYQKTGGITGNGNIGIDAPIVEISGRPDASGIYRGMLLEFNGELYNVVSVSYDSSLVKVVTDPVPSGPDLVGVDYKFYWPKQFISLLNLLKFAFIADKNFIIGIANFDFMQAQFNATLYEIFSDGEVDGDLTNSYAFQYLFQTN